MDNKIRITVDEILSLPDNSIRDAEILRQIGLLTTSTKIKLDRNVVDLIYKKINRSFEYCCLYPNVINSFDIIPDK